MAADEAGAGCARALLEPIQRHQHSVAAAASHHTKPRPPHRKQLPFCPHVLIRYSSCIVNSPELLRSSFPDMWDDEDNNPYGSFARHDSNSSDVPGLGSPGARKATTTASHRDRTAKTCANSAVQTRDAPVRGFLSRTGLA